MSKEEIGQYTNGAEANCNHTTTPGNINSGASYGYGYYCPYCQPKCPCCGRPYSGWGYQPYYPIWYGGGISGAIPIANPNIGQEKP